MRLLFLRVAALIAGAACAMGEPALARAADEPRIAIALEYQAHAGCPDAAAFELAVTSRAPELKLAEDPASVAAGSRFRITLTKSGAGTKGELSVGGVAARTIDGESCASVVAALAVVTALAAQAASEEAAATPTPPPVVEPPPPPPPAAASAEIAPAPAPRFRPELGAEVLAQSSRGALGLGVVAGITRDDPRTRLAPSVRIHARRLVDALVDHSFAWWLVSLEGCALRLPLASRLSARAPCLEAETGSLASNGFRADHARLWLAAGVSGRIGWAVTKALSLELTGSALAPITRDTFLAAPDATAYRADVILARIAFGATITLF